jgi:chemotaxis protein MotB
VDSDGQPMFGSASAKPLERTAALLAQVGRVIQALPNKIQISGHTDAVQFRGGSKTYGNWELSADRAGASRRILVENGFTPERVNMVVGRADQDPLVAEDVNSPRNRRISIILMREHPLPGTKPAQAAQADTGAKPGAPTAATTPAKTPPAEAKKFDRDWTGPRLR